MKRIFANNRLRLSVTDRCIFNCRYCTNEGQPHNNKNFINLDFIRKLSRFIKEQDIYIKKLNITGGEPLLHPDLIKIVEILRVSVESITLNTNGELLDRNKIIDLKNAGITCIKFGMDSFFQETTKPFYKKCTCHPKKILENLFFARGIMPRSSVNIVLTVFNLNEFENILNFCISNEIDLVEFLELINFDFRKNKMPLSPGLAFSSIFLNSKSYFTKISYNIRTGKYLSKINNILTMQFADDYCKSRVCKNLWTRIDASGHFIPCIKSGDRIKIDFNNFFEQVRINNSLMCDGPITKHIPRSYIGKLLLNGISGEYIPPYIDIVKNNKITLTNLDP